MYALIECPAGVVAEAVVLSMNRDSVRLAAAGFPDALELRRCGEEWFSETGQKIMFEFLLSQAPEEQIAALPILALATRAAGSYTIQPTD